MLARQAQACLLRLAMTLLAVVVAAAERVLTRCAQLQRHVRRGQREPQARHVVSTRAAARRAARRADERLCEAQAAKHYRQRLMAAGCEQRRMRRVNQHMGDCYWNRASLTARSTRLWRVARTTFCTG